MHVSTDRLDDAVYLISPVVIRKNCHKFFFARGCQDHDDSRDWSAKFRTGMVLSGRFGWRSNLS